MLKKLWLASALACSVAAFANDVSDTDYVMRTHHSLPVVCSIAEAGGGRDHFRTKEALMKALGNERAKAEIDKLSAQFGEGKVWRFLAASDFIVPEALRLASVNYGSSYEPSTYGRAAMRSYIYAGMDGDGKFSSEAMMDRVLGADIHAGVMKEVEERFGDDAGKNYHMILDQLCQDIASETGVSGMKTP